MNIRGWRRHDNAPDVAVRFVDADGTKFHQQYVQDIEPIVDANTRERNETGGWAIDRSKRKVGSVPVSVVWDKIREWQRRGELPPHGNPLFSSMLNQKLVEMLRDRDYAKFRTVDRV
jgi:hypothetical protein